MYSSHMHLHEDMMLQCVYSIPIHGLIFDVNGHLYILLLLLSRFVSSSAKCYIHCLYSRAWLWYHSLWSMLCFGHDIVAMAYTMCVLHTMDCYTRNYFYALFFISIFFNLLNQLLVLLVTVKY